MKHAMRWRLLSYGLFLLGVVPIVASAQSVAPAGRSYSYPSIDATIWINQDTTFSVEERQTFEYHGEYHQGLRDIPMSKVDAITDIEVLDGATGQTLVHSASQLDKTQVDSWGRYTTYEKNGEMNIEWYYDMHDTTHTWILRYIVHGGLSFYADHDELYWNILTSYSVPIARSSVDIVLPESADQSALRITPYVTPGVPVSSSVVDGQTFVASAEGLSPGAMFTVAAGWPKGIVDQQAYRRELLRFYGAFIGGAALLLISVVFSSLYWFFSEKFRKGRGVIVAQYEPPRGLPPALGEMIVKERMSKSTWAATLVDLAVRGLIAIRKEEATLMDRIGKGIISALSSGIFLLIILFVLARVILDGLPGMLLSPGGVMSGAVALFILAMTSRFWIFMRSMAEAGGYILSLKEDYHAHRDKFHMTEYECQLLDVLFDRSDTFSTRTLAEASPGYKQSVYKSLQEVQKELYNDVATLGMYVKDIKDEKNIFLNPIFLVSWGIIAVLFVMMVWSIGMVVLPFQYFFLIVAAAASVSLVSYFVFYEARLSDEGNVFREEWLGFKLYLETAERYRMQNLTPDIFEKYLPYAMVFGVEKKWAKAFESIALESPEWYSGGARVYGASSEAAAFSASGFSSGLSASLVSSLSSAGVGGGASGGGGGAGGGGGGGGGGAS